MHLVGSRWCQRTGQEVLDCGGLPTTPGYISQECVGCVQLEGVGEEEYKTSSGHHGDAKNHGERWSSGSVLGTNVVFYSSFGQRFKMLLPRLKSAVSRASFLCGVSRAQAIFLLLTASRGTCSPGLWALPHSTKPAAQHLQISLCL